ncbi:MAG: hypothetical protein SGILL_006235 [Bacillariaceae sp.]
MVAAESFQRLFENKQEEEPRVRRRTLEEAGHFGQNGASPSTSPIPSPPVGSQLEDPPAAPPSSSAAMGNPFLCASIPALSALTPTPGSNVHNLQQKVSQTGLVCRQRYGGVASKTVKKTKEGMTEFAVIASEVYRQECRSDHRGADQAFFVHEEKMDDSILMEDNSLLSLSEQRDNQNEAVNGSGARNKDVKRNMVVTPSTVGSSSSERLTPPPSVDRVLNSTDRSFQPSSMYDSETSSHHPQEKGASRSLEVNSDDPLRGARMELFRNQVAGIDNPEGRLARALEDLNRQDVFIQSLKRQMQLTQTTLDDTTRELEDVKSMAKDKQYKATEIRARAVQEKKRLEDLYEKEAKQGKKLRDNMSQLQREVATLKTSLRNARTSQSRSSPTQDTNNAQMISMRAELVELRSQLAEAHAVNIDDSSARHSSDQVEELKKKWQRDESELKDLNAKSQEGARERQELIQAEQKLRGKLESLQSSSKENEAQLKENLQIAIKSAEDARAELTKVKANVQRLERERTRARMHSSADVDRAQKDLVQSQKEVDVLKNDLARSRASAKAERKELAKEIEQLKEQLQNANQDRLANSTGMMREQRKLQDEVTCHVAEIRGLKEQLTSKDVEIVAKMKQIEDMEQTLVSLKAQSRTTSRGLDFSEKSAPKPENEVRSVAVEQTFKTEISVLKSKLAEAQTKIKEETSRAHEERRVNREDERDRRAEMERLQKEKDDAIRAKASLQSELAALRQRLGPSSSPAETADPVPEKDTVNHSSENTAPGPSNVTRLRSELAQARERLAAARENSRSLPVRPTTSPGPIHEPSAWSTRVMEAAQQPTPSVSENPEPRPSSGQPCAQPAVSTRSAPSADAKDVTKVPLVQRSKSPRSVQAKKSFSMEELTKQLELSRKRLQTADKRLNGLVGAGSSITVVRESISDSSFDGSIDEVVTEEESIEVSHRRFADV